MSFIDVVHGWAVGDDGAVVRTRDGGHTWSVHDAGTPAALWSVHFVDAERGWAVGVNGTVVASTDGGRSWTAQNAATNVALFGVDFVDAERGSRLLAVRVVGE